MDAEIELEVYSELTPIQKFYYGRNVFLTGATGFIGKVVIEKLLRCCPGIGQIYILMRPKRGKAPEERLDALFSVELFESLRNDFPAFRKKIELVDGDLGKERLGISEEDFQKLRQKVSIVIHSAALVRFDAHLRVAVQHHMIATQHLIDMCKEMPNIAAMVHVSTSYVHKEADNTIEERVYKQRLTPDQIFDIMKWMDDETLEKVTPFLVKDGKNNTYIFTKAMAEVIVDDRHGDIPTAIVRPCNISPTWKQPFPGWVDALQGISGLMLAAAKGFLRTLQSVRGLKVIIIPVDIVSNTVITSAWHVGTQRPKDVYVVNCVIDEEKAPLANELLLKQTLKKRTEYPLVNMYRYPDFTLYYNVYLYYLHAIIDQWIPALFFDIFIFIFTGKRIMLPLYKKIDFLFQIFLDMGKIPWHFKLNNYNHIMKTLTKEDSEVFYMDMDSLDWPNYIDDCMKGGRKFLAHEDPSNIPYAKKKAKIWLIVTTILKWFIIMFLLYYLIPKTVVDNVYKNLEGQFYALP